MTTTTSAPLRSAQSARDLVPGDIRAVASAQADLERMRAALADAATDLRTITGVATSWSGSAAAAFTLHTRHVGDTLDQWERAHALVRRALAGYQDRLAAAQDTAACALEQWHAARAQLVQLSASDPGMLAASNLDSLRTHARAALRRAAALLERARAELDAVGDDAATQVTAATRQLRAHPLRPLTHQHATTPNTADRPAAVPSGPTVVVQAPHAGVHDSLSRIAARTLGDPRRWPEIYRLNVDRLGRNPNLIQPGWILRLPATDHPPASDPNPRAGRPPTPPGTPGVPPSATRHNPAPTSGPPPQAPAITAPHPAPPAQLDPSRRDPLDDGVGHWQPPPASTSPIVAPPASPSVGQAGSAGPRTDDHGGVHLGDGALLAGGVVAGVASLAGGAAFLWHRRDKAGGDGSGTLDADAASESGPVVRELTADNDTSGTPTTAASDWLDQFDLPLAEGDGRTVLLDAATTFGLGLTGPGAPAAARALLLSVLTTHLAAQAILAQGDLQALGLARAVGHTISGRLTVVAQPADALAHLEAAILTRTRLLEESAGRHTPPPLTLITSAPADARRVQAIADLGAGLAITVVILGPWPAGLTCHIDADGRISTSHDSGAPEWTTTLNGLRAFTADADITRDLLVLLDYNGVSATDNQRSEPGGQPTPQSDDQPDPPPGEIAHRLAPDREPPDPASPAEAATAADPAKDGGRTPLPRAADSPTTHAPGKTIRLTIVGHFHVHYQPSTADSPADLTDRFSPRQREILTYLALHPEGTRRDTLIAALWPDNPGERPAASLHARLSQMRHTLRDATGDRVHTLTTHHDGYYALDPGTVDVDLWQLTEALHTHYHATDPRERTAALHEIAQLYQGHLADTITGYWIETARQALHRDALDAFATLIRTLRDDNPDRALELLEHTRTLDPHNEAIYRDIIRLQRRLGRHDSIPRTIELLRTALAEIDATPTPSTLDLASDSIHATNPSAAAPKPRQPTTVDTRGQQRPTHPKE